MTLDQNRQVTIWDLGHSSGSPSAPERAVEKVMRLFGWANTAIHQESRTGRQTPPILILFGTRNDERTRNDDRLELWKFIVEHRVVDVCVVNFGVSSKTARDAAFVARLAASCMTPSEGNTERANVSPEYLVKKVAAGPDQWQCISTNHLQQWVSAIAGLIGNDASGFLAHLAGLAVDAEEGIDIAVHSDLFKKFKRPEMEVFRAWYDALVCMKSADRVKTSDGRQIGVAVLDDRRDFIDTRLLPEWMWSHSEFDFQVKDAAKFRETIDNCTSIARRARAESQADIFLLDMDLRHVGPEVQLQSYLLELTHRYNKQIRFASLQEVAEALAKAGTDEDAKRYLEEWSKIYFEKEHHEGVVLYHYLKAFDESLPIVVFTADHKNKVKSRQTAGPNTEFLGKYDLMEHPTRMLEALRGVFKGRKRDAGDYGQAAKLCQALIEKHRTDVAALDVDKDKLVKKTATRVVALLEMVGNQATPPRYFGRNFELSQPTGSMCAERSAIAAALAANPTLGGRDGDLYEEFRLIAVLGDPQNTKRKNPCPPCGVCSEWIDKLQERTKTTLNDNSESPNRLDVVMFSRCCEHFCYYPLNDRISY